MKTHRIIFTPSEPYFFGNEKTFRFSGSSYSDQYDNPYFIRSEALPSQTTLFGAVRYLLLSNRDPEFASYPENYEKLIGKDSFRITDTEVQEFGKIKNMSPAFLQFRKASVAVPKADTIYPEDGIYVKTPLDHCIGNDIYTPFKRAPITEESECPKREYSEDYNAKKGLSDSYMNIETGKIIDSSEIFKTVTRVGISKKQGEDAYFKKEFYMLSDGWSFGVYLDHDFDDEYMHKLDPVVFMGQNKSAFIVECVPEENELKKKVSEYLKSNTVYCLGDIYVNSSIYSNFTFAVTLTRDHRAYETIMDKDNSHRRICKGSKLHKLIRAGSVFWFDQSLLNAKRKDGIEEIFEHSGNQKCQFMNAKTIGMNQIIIKE